MALIVDIKPLSCYLYNSSVEIIMKMAEQIKNFLEVVRFSGGLDSQAQSKMSRTCIEKGPFFCVDFIFFPGFDIKIFAMSNSNLDLVNYIPNLHFNMRVTTFNLTQRIFFPPNIFKF